MYKASQRELKSSLQVPFPIVNSLRISSLALLSFLLLYVGQPIAFSATFTTWSQRATTSNWSSVACNLNCETAYSTVNPGLIYKSDDGGSNWTTLSSSGSKSWKAVTTSSSGQILYAIASIDYIYKSQDGGLNWISVNNSQTRSWLSIATDSTGTTIVAGTSGGGVWLSSDSGSTWSEIATIGTSATWKSVAITPDGAVIAAGNSSGQIWRGALSAGSWSWNNVTLNKTATPLYGGSAITLSGLSWNSLILNSTGDKIAAASNDLYFSADSGSTWRNVTWGNYGWVSLSGSSDLKTMMLLASNGCGSNCRPHILTTSDYSTFSESIVGSIGVAYSSGAFAKNGSRAIAATSTSYIYTAGDTYVPVATATLSVPVSIVRSTTTNLTVTVTPTTGGKITFYVNKRRIPGCIGRTVSGSAFTCTFKPNIRGNASFYAVFTPTGGTPASTTTSTIAAFIASRTSSR